MLSHVGIFVEGKCTYLSLYQVIHNMYGPNNQMKIQTWHVHHTTTYFYCKDLINMKKELSSFTLKTLISVTPKSMSCPIKHNSEPDNFYISQLLCFGR